jgi:hypothetical protein
VVLLEVQEKVLQVPVLLLVVAVEPQHLPACAAGGAAAARPLLSPQPLLLLPPASPAELTRCCCGVLPVAHSLLPCCLPELPTLAAAAAVVAAAAAVPLPWLLLKQCLGCQSLAVGL